MEGRSGGGGEQQGRGLQVTDGEDPVTWKVAEMLAWRVALARCMARAHVPGALIGGGWQGASGGGAADC